MNKLDMRKFRKWLKANAHCKVGYVGVPCQLTPILQFAQECNVSPISISKSRWGRKYGQLCENYQGVPGRVDGFEAQCILADAVGYQKAFA